MLFFSEKNESKYVWTKKLLMPLNLPVRQVWIRQNVKAKYFFSPFALLGFLSQRKHLYNRPLISLLNLGTPVAWFCLVMPSWFEFNLNKLTLIEGGFGVQLFLHCRHRFVGRYLSRKIKGFIHETPGSGIPQNL